MKHDDIVLLALILLQDVVLLIVSVALSVWVCRKSTPVDTPGSGPLASGSPRPTSHPISRWAWRGIATTRRPTKTELGARPRRISCELPVEGGPLPRLVTR